MEAGRNLKPKGGQRSTWIAFAGVMMVIIGCLDVMWGLAAIFNSEVVVVGGHGVMILDITAWGWVELILGIIIALTGVGLIAGNTAARWFGVFLLGFNAIVQVVWFSAAPLWAFLIIILDLVLIYHLCVNWEEE